MPVYSSQSSIAKKLNFSRSYICGILKGKRNCDEKVKKELEKAYPKLKFKKIVKVTYCVLNGGDE